MVRRMLAGNPATFQRFTAPDLTGFSFQTLTPADTQRGYQYRIIMASGVEGFVMIEGWTGRRAGSGVKGQAALLEYDLGNAPQVYADGIYIVPHANGTVAIWVFGEVNAARVVEALNFIHGHDET